MGRLESQSRVLLHRVIHALLLLLRVSFRPLSPEVAVRIGAAFGSTYARLRGPRTRDAATNLKIAFPDSSDDERRRLAAEAKRLG